MSAAAIVEINSETDFVAKNEEFKNFVSAAAELALRAKPADLVAFKASELENGKIRIIEERKQKVIIILKKKLQIPQFTKNTIMNI